MNTSDANKLLNCRKLYVHLFIKAIDHDFFMNFNNKRKRHKARLIMNSQLV